MKFIRFSLWMSAFGALVVLGLNFSHPTEKSMLRSRQIQKRLNNADHAAPEKRYVQIEGRLYEHNPKNVYNVNGVPTYYKPPKNGFVNVAHLQNQVHPTANPVQPSDPTALDKVRRMAESGPLSAYGPGGMQAIIDGANQAREKAEERNRALNQLMKE